MTDNIDTTGTIHAATSSPERPRHTLTSLTFLAFSAAVLVSCGSSNPASVSSEATVATVASSPSTTPATRSTTAAPAALFHSALYGYVVSSPEWSGVSASITWNGTGSPGSGDPTVDILQASDTQQAYAFAAPTTETLDEFVAASRAANTVARGCPTAPADTGPITVAGERGILDEVVCGVFALSATVMHAGQVYVFFTYDQPGKEAEMREWFAALLQSVAFDS